MALSYVGGASSVGTSNGYTVSLTGLTGGSNSAPSVGDLVVVVSAFGNTASSAPNIVGNVNGTYTPFNAAVHVNDTYDTEFIASYKVMTSSVDTSLTITRTNNTAYGGATVVMVFRGQNSSAPIYSSTAYTTKTNGAYPNVTNVSVATAGDFVVAMGAGTQPSNGSAFTVPSQLTTGSISVKGDGSTSDIGVWMAFLESTATGSQSISSPTGGVSNSSSSGAAHSIAIAVQPAIPDDLLADDVQSTSEVTTPSLTEIDTSNELLAEDVQSTTEVTTTVIGQTHNILADDVQSLTEVTTSTLGQEHGLLSVFVQSSSELTTPALSEASTVDDLLSEDVQSTSEVSTAVVGQRHELLSTSVSSTTEVTTATLAGTHTLVNASVQSSSELTIPLLSSISSVDSLFANSVQSLSEALTSLLSQDHNLSVISVQSNSTLSSPGQYSQIGTIEGFSSVTIPFSTGRTYYTRNNGYYLISVSSF